MSLTTELIALIRAKTINDADYTAAALFTLDALAAAYAGSATPVGATLLKWAKSHPLDLKRQVFLMGALAHITETDDLHRASVTHPGCVVVPVALGLGQQLDARPKKVLAAILHGYEAMCRIGAAVGTAHYKVWHNTATCGPYGAAMAAAHLLDLDAQQTMHALGNAGTQSCGFWQFMETGAMSKHLHAGRAAESGYLAAELAAYGFTGAAEILEGEKGMFAGMCADPIPAAVLATPEAPWQLSLTSIKPWPACRHTHPAIDCALELQQQLNAAAIAKIELATYQAALAVCDRRRPSSEYQAKFSLYHTVCIALLNGEVTLNSFTQAARAQTLSLAANMQIKVADPYASDYPRAWGSGLRVITASGRVLQTSRKHCKGDPELAMSAAQMRDKAGDLMQYGGLKRLAAAQVCDSVSNLPMAKHSIKLFSNYIAHVS